MSSKLRRFTCETCEGEGDILLNHSWISCPDCDGSGHEKQTESRKIYREKKDTMKRDKVSYERKGYRLTD